MSNRTVQYGMLRPVTTRIPRARLEALAEVIFEMAPSRTYLDILQTLLNQMVVIGDDCIVSPELGQLLAPANMYVGFAPESIAGQDSHQHYAHGQRGFYHQSTTQQPAAVIPYRRESPVYRDSSPLTDFRNVRMATPPQAGRPSNQGVPRGMVAPQNSPASNAGPSMTGDAELGNDRKTIPPEPLPQVTPFNNATTAGVDPENNREGTPPSPMPQVTANVEDDEDQDEDKDMDEDEDEDENEVGLPAGEIPQTNLAWNMLINFQNQARLRQADFVDQVAYNNAMKVQDPNEPEWVRERKAFDMVFTSGWADQSKDVKGQQLMTNGGKAFLEFSKKD